MGEFKLRFKRARLFVVPIMLFAVVLFAPAVKRRIVDVCWRIDPRADLLDKAAQGVAEFGTVDCGRATSLESSASVDSCIAKASQQGLPVRGRFDASCLDGSCSTIIVKTKSKTISLFLGKDGIVR